MGKVRIVGGGEAGQYSVEVLYNRDRIDAEIEWLTARIAELTAERDALQAEYDTAVVERDAAAAAVDQKIAEHISAGADGAPNVEAELVALANASAKVQSLDVNLTMVKGRLLEVQKRKDALDAIPSEQIQPAWCADHTEDLEGEVRSVEVPDEGRENLLIYPGHNNGNVYSQARDGQLFWREGQVGYQAYFNAAILPGVQRWHPQFRFATIESVDKAAHTATIAYASMDSSAQGLLITDPNAKRTDVPIEYMQCHSAVFEEGDQVLVELQGRDWQQPKIIGFRSHPKRCSIIMAYNVAAQYTTGAILDPETGGRPALPDGYFRNLAVYSIKVGAFGGDGLALLYANNLQGVLDATLISEMPAFQASAILSRPFVEKGEMTVKTAKRTRVDPNPPHADQEIDVPVVGTATSGSSVYPINKPPDEFMLTAETLTVTYRQFASVTHEFFNDGNFPERQWWSNQVDVFDLAGEVEVEYLPEDFPNTIEWEGTTYVRKEFVNFVPFDFDNDRGEAGPWQLDRICIRYEPE